MKKKLRQWLACLLALTMVLTLSFSLQTTAADTTDTGEPLAITTQALENAVAGTAYEQKLTTNGGSGQAVTWALVEEDPKEAKADNTQTSAKSGLPDGIKLDTKEGILSGTPSAAGTWAFTLSASDGTETASKKAFTLTVTEAKKATEEKKAPVITTDTLKEGIVGEDYSASFEATADGEITWALAEGSSLPDGLNLSKASITGVPQKEGTYTFTITATCNEKTAQKEFSLTIQKAKEPEVIPPTITTTSLPDGELSKPYSFRLEADGTKPIEWTLENKGALPEGISLSREGLLSGTPTVHGTFAFTIAATNTKSSTEKGFTLKIAGEDKLAPSILTEALPDGTTGTVYSVTLKAKGTEPVVWNVQKGSTLPEGLQLQGDTLSGTPKKAGTFQFTLTAHNEVGTAEKNFTLVIQEAKKAPVITTKTLPDGMTGTAYSAALKADGTAPFKWAVADGTLPDGITLSGDTLKGTPAKAGTFTFTLSVSNEAGTVKQEYKVTVKEAPKKYEVTVVTDGNGKASADITSALADTKITLSATANKDYRFKEWKLVKGTVTIKNNTFLMPKENVTVKAIFEKIPFVYKVTAGQGGTHLIGSGKSLSFTCNGDKTKLVGLYVDKNLVNSSYYTLKSGSTIATLKADYLDKLKVGTHTLTFKYADGSVDTTFKITAKTAAKTGDPTTLWIWLFTAGIAFLSAAIIIVYKKRHTK